MGKNKKPAQRTEEIVVGDPNTKSPKVRTPHTLGRYCLAAFEGMLREARKTLKSEEKLDQAGVYFTDKGGNIFLVHGEGTSRTGECVNVICNEDGFPQYSLHAQYAFNPTWTAWTESKK